jgi:hypothetical protein
MTTKASALTHGFHVRPEATRAPVNKCGIYTEIAQAAYEYWIEWQNYSLYDQLCLAVPNKDILDSVTHHDQLTIGCGRLHTTNYKDRDFVHLVRGAEFIQPLFDYAKIFGYVPSRPMIRYLGPKQCLSYHKDDVGVRFHLVVSTHPEAFFIVQDIVYRMPEAGSLYTLRTDVMHTAVNANLNQPRIHLTFSAYKEDAE